MEKPTTFDLGILRKIREQIVSALKQASFVLGDHYNLSAATDQNASFTIQFLMSSKLSATINGWKSSAMKSLTKEFGNHYTVSGEQKTLKIHLRDWYKIQLTKKPKEEVVVKKEGQGRPKGEVSLLEAELVEHLHKHTTLRLHERGSGFVIVSRLSGERYVTLGFAGEITFNKALCCLETAYADNIKIIESGKKWSFAVSNDALSFTPTEKESRLLAQSFLTTLKQAVRVLDGRAVVLTPYLLIAKEPVAKIDIQFAGSAIMASYNRVAEKFPAKKEGPIVSITVSPEDIEKYDREELRFIRVNKKRGFKYKELEVAGVIHRTYTEISMNYDEFHLLPFNRKIVKSHVLELIESIRAFGVLSFLIVAETDCIDGVMKKWIVDGQHRSAGFKSEGLPYLFTKVEVSTKEEMVRLIAKLNCTSSNWSLKNYLDAWSSLHIYDYHFLKQQHKKTSLPLTLLIQICENKPSVKSAQTSFLEGTFKIMDEAKALTDIELVAVPQKYLPSSRDLSAGLYMFIRKLGTNYDSNRMMRQLEAQKDALPFVHGDEIAVIISKFESIYNTQNAQIA